MPRLLNNQTDADLELIHFDTLLDRALADIKTLAGNNWTDTGPHDPGITMLEALTWSVSDVAYRHTLPLLDLLASTQELNPELATLMSTLKTDNTPAKVFDDNFFPERTLTTAPVTVDDYKRVIISLKEKSDPNSFLIRNAQVKTVPQSNDNSDNTFFYYPVTGQYLLNADSVIPPTGKEKLKPQKMQIQGFYNVWLEPEYGAVVQDVTNAFNEFKENNRHVGEDFNDCTIIQPQEVSVWLKADVDDDLDHMQTEEAFWAIVSEISKVVRPPVPCGPVSSSDDLDGPKLESGYISELPVARDYENNYTIDLAPLSERLLKIKGVKKINWLSLDEKSISWLLEIERLKYPKLWEGENAKQVLKKNISLFKKGMKQDISNDSNSDFVSRLTSIFTRTPPQSAQKNTLMGSYRNQLYTTPAATFMPGFYGMKTNKIGSQNSADNTFSFLWIFMLWIYQTQKKLAILPKLMNFDRMSQSGSNINNFENDLDKTALEVLNYPSVSSLNKINIDALSSFRHDDDKELSIVSYLLSYFGEQRGLRVLNSKDFVNTQKAFLSQVADIDYNRSLAENLTSWPALQKRIAARIGTGEKLFESIVTNAVSGTGQTPSPPFLMVETRKLLPDVSQQKGFKFYFIVASKFENDEFTITILSSKANNPFPLVNTLVDITIDHYGEIDEVHTQTKLSNLLVFKADATSGTITFNLQTEYKLHDRQALISDGITKNMNLVTLSHSNNILDNVTFPFDANALVNNNIVTISLRDTPPPFTGVNSVVNLFQNQPKYDSSTERTFKINTGVWGVVKSITGNKVEILLSPDQESIKKAAYSQSELEQFLANEDNSCEFLPSADRDELSFSLSFIFKNSVFNDSNSDDTLNWVRKIIEEEIPAHLHYNLYILPDNEFSAFNEFYITWKSHGYRTGSDAYYMLEKLKLGRRPSDGTAGIGDMQISSPAQKGALPNGHDANYILSGLYFVAANSH